MNWSDSVTYIVRVVSVEICGLFSDELVCSRAKRVVRGNESESARMASVGSDGLSEVMLEMVPESFIYVLAGFWGRGIGEKMG